MEIVALRTGGFQVPLVQPNITIFQDKDTEGEVIIVLDSSRYLNQEMWSIVRLGLEQMFVSLSPSTYFALIRNSEVVVNRTRISKVEDELLGQVIFPENVQQMITDFVLKESFDTVRSLLPNFTSPQIMLITGTTETDPDLEETLSFIRENRLEVNTLTFSSVRTPSLLDLSMYGEVFSIPFYGLQTSMAAYAGAAMQKVVSGIEGKNYQQIVANEDEIPLISDAVIAGEFSIDESTSTSLDNATMDVVFLLPWSNARADVYLTSPNRTVYSNTLEHNTIGQKWSSQVFYLRDDLPIITGNWHYSIRKPNGVTTSSNFAYVTLSLDVGQEAFGSSFFEANATRALNASGLFALSVFGQIERASSSDILNFTCFVLHSANPAVLELRDDGLIVPDVTSGDGIYSQYYFEAFSDGFYSTRFVVRDSSSLLSRYWVGPSLYITDGIDTNGGQDVIPPSRITDLKIRTYNTSRVGFVSLIWTAPGDNLNDGEGTQIIPYFFSLSVSGIICKFSLHTANYYRVFCGLSRDDLTYDDCIATRSGTSLFAHPAGEQEMMNITVIVIGVPVYFGVKAYDGAGNAGDMSNVAVVLIPGEPTVTSKFSKLELLINRD